MGNWIFISLLCGVACLPTQALAHLTGPRLVGVLVGTLVPGVLLMLVLIWGVCIIFHVRKTRKRKARRDPFYDPTLPGVQTSARSWHFPEAGPSQHIPPQPQPQPQYLPNVGSGYSMASSNPHNSPHATYGVPAVHSSTSLTQSMSNVEIPHVYSGMHGVPIVRSNSFSTTVPVMAQGEPLVVIPPPRAAVVTPTPNGRMTPLPPIVVMSNPTSPTSPISRSPIIVPRASPGAWDAPGGVVYASPIVVDGGGYEVDSAAYGSRGVSPVSPYVIVGEAGPSRGKSPGVMEPVQFYDGPRLHVYDSFDDYGRI